jgi:hypothetical protein
MLLSQLQKVIEDYKAQRREYLNQPIDQQN